MYKLKDGLEVVGDAQGNPRMFTPHGKKGKEYPPEKMFSFDHTPCRTCNDNNMPCYRRTMKRSHKDSFDSVITSLSCVPCADKKVKCVMDVHFLWCNKKKRLVPFELEAFFDETHTITEGLLEMRKMFPDRFDKVMETVLSETGADADSDQDDSFAQDWEAQDDSQAQDDSEAPGSYAQDDSEAPGSYAQDDWYAEGAEDVNIDYGGIDYDAELRAFEANDDYDDEDEDDHNETLYDYDAMLRSYDDDEAEGAVRESEDFNEPPAKRSRFN